MSRRQLFLTAVAGLHLVVVACGAASLFRIVPPSPPVRAVQWYGDMSGASMGYGFFAPGVGPQVRVVFVLSDDQGHSWKDDFEAGRNQEVRLRMGSVVRAFPLEEGNEALRRDMLTSWAEAMLARNPEAKKVEIHIEAFEVPSRAEYRSGARPAWLPVYSASFTRDEHADERRLP